MEQRAVEPGRSSGGSIPGPANIGTIPGEGFQLSTESIQRILVNVAEYARRDGRVEVVLLDSTESWNTHRVELSVGEERVLLLQDNDELVIFEPGAVAPKPCAIDDSAELAATAIRMLLP